jgi:hypothetical protein
MSIKKGEVAPVHTVKAHTGSVGTPPLILISEEGTWLTSRPGHFTLGNDPVPIEQKPGRTPELAWTFFRRKECLPPSGIRAPYLPVGSLVTIPTEIL